MFDDTTVHGSAPGTREAQASPLPRLSPSQRAYRENPDGFLSRLRERAEALFETGYDVRPGTERHCFVVTAPPDRHGIVFEYTVDALADTCTCPFWARQVEGERLGDDEVRIACKHVLGLPTLVRAVRRQLAKESDPARCCALFKHWMVTMTEKRRLRCEAERQEKGVRPC